MRRIRFRDRRAYEAFASGAVGGFSGPLRTRRYVSMADASLLDAMRASRVLVIDTSVSLCISDTSLRELLMRARGLECDDSESEAATRP